MVCLVNTDSVTVCQLKMDVVFLQLVVVKDVKFFQHKTLLKATVLETVVFLFAMNVNVGV